MPSYCKGEACAEKKKQAHFGIKGSGKPQWCAICAKQHRGVYLGKQQMCEDWYWVEKAEDSVLRTSEVHVAVSLDVERLSHIQHETATVEGRCTACVCARYRGHPPTGHLHTSQKYP